MTILSWGFADFFDLFDYGELFGSYGGVSSIGISVGTLKLSLAQAPRSRLLHRSQQKGRNGLSGE